MPIGRIDRAESAWRSSLQEFGEQLRHKREHVLRLTQAQMAARVGIDQSRISRIEKGHKPRNKATAVILAEAYRLSAAETKAWLELLYGSTTLFVKEEIGRADVKLEIGHLYDFLEQIHGNPITPRSYDYFHTAPSEAFLHPNGSDDALIVVIDWLLVDSHKFMRDHLLVEFAAVLMHHLNQRGQHRRRLALALAAANAARDLERRTVEGWLRSDAIPWTLMERQRNATAARSHLERGLTLARELENRDMEALALAFLAQACLMSGDNQHARTYLTRARRLQPSAAILTRIEWIDGDLAMRQKRYDEAFILYGMAEMVDVELGGGHHTVVTPLFRLAELYLRLLDLPAAKQAYETLLSDMRPPLIGHRLARASFGLARVTRMEGNVEGARRLIDEALAALATADDDPQFRQIIGLFVASLPG
jgi:transcriptional regulator with XRE-family HTH domain/tetratricopeptide (TPR) repeat protein